MHTPFTSSSSFLLTAQPSSSGEKLIYRSSDASDTGNASITGLVSAVSTTDTAALTGKREVQTSDTYTSLTAVNLASAQAGTVTVYGQGTKAIGSIRVDTLPANNDTLLVGLTGFTQTYTFKTTLTGAANEIKIAASINAQATNIYEALNAGANAGTDYGTGTTANAYVTASAPSGAALAITDKIAVSRSLAWAISQGAGTTLTITSPSGGVTGTLLATVAIGDTSRYNEFTLDTEDLATKTLPAKVAPTTASVLINGKTCTLRFLCENISSGIPVKYQTSTDNSNWHDGAVSISNLDNNTQFIVPTEQNIQRIRLVFTGNTNTSDSAIDARVIFPLV